MICYYDKYQIITKITTTITTTITITITITISTANTSTIDNISITIAIGGYRYDY